MEAQYGIAIIAASATVIAAIIGLFASYISFHNKISEHRVQWIENLRCAMRDIFEGLIQDKTSTDPELYKQLKYVEMMLNPDKEKDPEHSELVDELLKADGGSPPDWNRITELSQKIYRKEWKKVSTNPLSLKIEIKCYCFRKLLVLLGFLILVFFEVAIIVSLIWFVLYVSKTF